MGTKPIWVMMDPYISWKFRSVHHCQFQLSISVVMMFLEYVFGRSESANKRKTVHYFTFLHTHYHSVMGRSLQTRKVAGEATVAPIEKRIRFQLII